MTKRLPEILTCRCCQRILFSNLKVWWHRCWFYCLLFHHVTWYGSKFIEGSQYKYCLTCKKERLF